MDEIDKRYYLPHKRKDETIEETRKRVDDDIINKRFVWIMDRDIPAHSKP